MTTFARATVGVKSAAARLAGSQRPLIILVGAVSVCLQLLDVGLNVTDLVHTQQANAGDLVSVADFLIGLAVAMVVRRT